MTAAQDFKQLIRFLYTYLKAFRHAKTLWASAEQKSTTIPTFMISRLALLSTSVWPELPNSTTELWIYGDACNWLHTEWDIVKDHYQECLETTQARILSTLWVRWQEAWQTAIKWARRNLKILQESTIQLASQMVTKIIVYKTSGSTGSPCGFH